MRIRPVSSKRFMPLCASVLLILAALVLAGGTRASSSDETTSLTRSAVKCASVSPLISSAGQFTLASANENAGNGFASLLMLEANSSLPSGLQSRDRKHCTSNEAKWVEPSCGESEILVKIHNTCSEKIEVQLCLQRTDGTWSCGQSTVTPGSHMRFWDCSGNGNYKWWAAAYPHTGGFPEP